MSITVNGNELSLIVSEQVAVIETAPITQTLVTTPRVASVLTGGTQGPIGPTGLSQQEEQLNQDKEFEILDDTPSAGDTTIYEGYYIDETAISSEAKFKIFKTFIPASGVGGYRRINEEGGFTGYNQIWDNRASLTY